MSHTYLVTHKHHIIPKHLGGDDHPSNLVTLSVKQHAKAHWVLFHLYGHEKDLWAYRLLSGQVGRDEYLSHHRRENYKKYFLASQGNNFGSCLSCKKTFNRGNFSQHNFLKCHHPPVKGTYTHIVSCRSCKKSFTKANWKQHQRGSVVHIETRECWPLKKFLRHHKSHRA